jgi:hypothetical protein
MGPLKKMAIEVEVIKFAQLLEHDIDGRGEVSFLLGNSASYWLQALRRITGRLHRNIYVVFTKEFLR